jgi:hypothetical protein
MHTVFPLDLSPVSTILANNWIVATGLKSRGKNCVHLMLAMRSLHFKIDFFFWGGQNFIF